jgi:hypothetical protein
MGRVEGWQAAVAEVLGATWHAIVPVVVALWLSVEAFAVRFRGGDLVINGEPAFFLIAGYRWANGVVMYRETFDAKPPGVFETAALASLVTGGNQVLMWTITMALTTMAALGTLALVAALVRGWTGSPWGAAVAGLVPLTIGEFHALYVPGLRAKPFFLVFGLAAVYLYCKRRPALAAASAVLSAAFWQFGLIFAVGIVGGYVVGPERPPWRRLGLGGGTVAAIVLLPIVAGGAFVHLLEQALIVPAVISEGKTAGERLSWMLRELGGNVVGLAYGAGMLGTATVVEWTLRDELYEHLAAVRGVFFVPLLVGWFGLQVTYFDYDSLQDFVPFLVMASLAIGIAIAAIDRGRQRTLPAPDWGVIVVGLVVVVVLYLNVTGQGTAFPTGATPIETYSDAGCHLKVALGAPDGGLSYEWFERTGVEQGSSPCQLHFLRW